MPIPFRSSRQDPLRPIYHWVLGSRTVPKTATSEEQEFVTKEVWEHHHSLFHDVDRYLHTLDESHVRVAAARLMQTAKAFGDLRLGPKHPLLSRLFDVRRGYLEKAAQLIAGTSSYRMQPEAKALHEQIREEIGGIDFFQGMIPAQLAPEMAFREEFDALPAVSREAFIDASDPFLGLDRRRVRTMQDDAYDRSMIQGRLPYGTFATLVENALSRIAGRPTLHPLQVNDFPSVERLQWGLAEGGVNPATIDRAVKSWISERFDYPDLAERMHGDLPFLRLMHASALALEGTGRGRVEDTLLAADMLLGSALTMVDAISCAELAVRAGFDSDLACTTIAPPLFDSRAFSLFKGVLPEEHATPEQEAACVKVLQYYLSARLELARLAWMDEPRSGKAALDAKMAADLLERVSTTNASEREARDALQMEFYDLALAACPEDRDSKRLASEIVRRMRSLRAGDPSGMEPGGSLPPPSGNAPPGGPVGEPPSSLSPTGIPVEPHVASAVLVHSAAMAMLSMNTTTFKA